MHKEAHWERDKVQFIDGWLTLLFSSAARTFHTNATVTSHKCDSGYKLSKNLFWNIFIISIHGLVYFRQNTKEVFKEFPKTKDAKIPQTTSTIFLSALYSSSLMILMLKSYPAHVLVLFNDVMDAFGSSFSPHFSACMLTASNKSLNNTVTRECAWYCVVEWCLLGNGQIILNSLIKAKLSIFGWFLASNFFNPVQTYLKRFWLL